MVGQQESRTIKRREFGAKTHRAPCEKRRNYRGNSRHAGSNRGYHYFGPPIGLRRFLTFFGLCGFGGVFSIFLRTASRRFAISRSLNSGGLAIMSTNEALTIGEEKVAFYYQLGRAITTWAYGAICLRDMAGYALEFLALSRALENFEDRLVPQEERFPKSQEQPPAPPTLAQLRREIYEYASRPPRPSRG